MVTWNEVKDDPNAIKCLDHGFVVLKDHMGDDQTIVQSARVSYGKGTKQVSEDRHLIRYLLRHQHTTPFEMVEFRFLMKLPIFVARQLVRHRTANINEYSGRYSEMPNEFYIPELVDIAPQSKSNHQGRAGEMDPIVAAAVRGDIEAAGFNAYDLYRQLIGNDDYGSSFKGGIAKELARMVLPLNNYTEWYWKIDLKNLMHFLKLREDSHAQKEIQVFANAVHHLIEPIVPLAMEAFKDYWQEGATLSRMELKLFQDLVKEHWGDLTDQEIETKIAGVGLLGREANEFKEKVNL
jgi:thymidylate synthase (FAD)